MTKNYSGYNVNKNYKQRLQIKKQSTFRIAEAERNSIYPLEENQISKVVLFLLTTLQNHKLSISSVNYST